MTFELKSCWPTKLDSSTTAIFLVLIFFYKLHSQSDWQALIDYIAIAGYRTVQCAVQNEELVHQPDGCVPSIGGFTNIHDVMKII